VSDPSGYRTDIDGLRAIAVLSIIAFHAGFRWCLGGYRGVDMFFVISGFLITGILLREHEAGSFTLAGFYERRARRILPALFVMLLVTGFAAWIIMLPADLKLFGQNLSAIALFTSNILFWKRAGGFDFYFEPSAQLNPLLHTWSLGVEEQFYLIFPLLVWFGWRLWRRRLFQLVVLTALVSFVYSSLIDGDWGLGLPVHKEANFYLLPARAWELMVGAIVAFWVARRGDVAHAERAPLWRQVLAAVGLVLVGRSMLVTGSWDYYYPSITALPATLGAAMILAWGSGTVASTVLSWRPLAGIGLISYSAYLWHQPLFAFSHYMSLNAGLDNSTKVGLIVVSLGVAWASWRYVEAPFRNRRRVSRRVIFGVAVLGTTWVLASGLLLGINSLNRYLPSRGHLISSPTLLDTLAATKLPAAMRECAFDRAGSTADDLGCALNPASAAAPTFVVLGDSHAGALLPAFRQLSEQTGEQGRAVVLRGCPPVFGVYAELEATCLAMQPAVFGYVQRHHITRVFLAARWAGYTDGDYDGKLDVFLSQASWTTARSKMSSRTAIVDGLKRTIDAYAEAGVTVDIVAQVPQQIHRPLGIYLQALLHRDAESRIRASSITTPRHRALQAFMTNTFAAYRDHPRVKMVDLSSALCPDNACPVGTLDASYYWDFNHLSQVGALHVSDALKRASFGRVP